MKTDTIAGLIRTALAALAGYAAGKGFDISGLATPEVSGAIAVVGVALWSAISKRSKPTA